MVRKGKVNCHVWGGRVIPCYELPLFQLYHSFDWGIDHLKHKHNTWASASVGPTSGPCMATGCQTWPEQYAISVGTVWENNIHIIIMHCDSKMQSIKPTHLRTIRHITKTWPLFFSPACHTRAPLNSLL